MGRAVAHEFARHGWNVGLIARGEAGLSGAIRDVTRAGGTPMAFAADVADAEAVREAADALAKRFGGIDVWVNNAMVTIYAPVQETSPDEFRRVTEVTYLGQVHGTLAALSHMVPRNAGTIVHVGSALAYRSIPLQATYCAAKAAVRGFVDSLRSELLHDKSRVRLTMVQLPAVNTPQFDWARSRMPRQLQPVPADLPARGDRPARLPGGARGAARALDRGRPAWKAILGNMLVPGWIDGYLARNGYEGEMTDVPARADRPDNLYDPVDTDPGAHGRFDERAIRHVVAADPALVKVRDRGGAGARRRDDAVRHRGARA